MENLEGYINFWPEFEGKREIAAKDYCFIYYRNQLILKQAEGLQVPRYEECEAVIQNTTKMWYLGKWHNNICFAYALEEDEALNPFLLKGMQIGEATQGQREVQEKLQWVDLRDERWSEELEMYQIAVKTQHLLNWDKSTKYCGCCGSLYERKEDERAKKCPKCGNLQFPRISPAIIVGIKKGDEILMAHNSGFREGLYSVIAGFVEQGETLEMAVKREIYEEVGIKVKNIQYFQSRPWNSIDSLMLGFIAEYESGEIKVDGKEIVDAKWCDKDHMPAILPSKISTAWHIINEIMGLE
ncbi:MAG: NAD(+) diphosphatase [Cellulosilyticum sp.]|nr:NAD(+) diphosphatase [Cellulosilyticum sp.]